MVVGTFFFEFLVEFKTNVKFKILTKLKILLFLITFVNFWLGFQILTQNHAGLDNLFEF